MQEGGGRGLQGCESGYRKSSGWFVQQKTGPGWEADRFRGGRMKGCTIWSLSFFWEIRNKVRGSYQSFWNHLGFSAPLGWVQEQISRFALQLLPAAREQGLPRREGRTQKAQGTPTSKGHTVPCVQVQSQGLGPVTWHCRNPSPKKTLTGKYHLCCKKKTRHNKLLGEWSLPRGRWSRWKLFRNTGPLSSASTRAVTGGRNACSENSKFSHADLPVRREWWTWGIW